MLVLPSYIICGGKNSLVALTVKTPEIKDKPELNKIKGLQYCWVSNLPLLFMIVFIFGL